MLASNAWLRPKLIKASMPETDLFLNPAPKLVMSLREISLELKPVLVMASSTKVATGSAILS